MPKNRKTTGRFVAYYRVSSRKQSKEMVAQKTAVRNYLGNRWPPEKSFTEQLSGKSIHNREQLKEALEYAYDNDATLVVAKLDRLSRDLEFIGWIQNTGIKFVCCDMPEATRETIGFMGVMARWEREQIAQRTKEALAERKKAGVKLGSHHPKTRRCLEKMWKEKRRQKKIREKALEKERKALAKKRKKNPEPPKLTKAQIADQRVIPTIKVMRSQDKTFKEIADALNKSGIPSRWGCRWHKTSVLRVADRNGLE